MKTHTRLSICAAVLAAPLVVVAICGVLYAAYEVPKAISKYHTRQRDELSAIAAGLRKGEVAPDFIWKYRTGVIAGDYDGYWSSCFPSNMTWKAWRPCGRRALPTMWGWRARKQDDEGGAIVWARNGDCIYAKVAEVDDTDWQLISWMVLAMLLLGLAIVTIVPIWVMRKYAKSRDDFLMAVAHDLSSPLIAMRRLIGVDNDDAIALNERLLRMVNNIGAFLRIGGVRKYECDRVDLLDAYRRAYRTLEADFRDKFDGKDIELEPSAEPVVAWCEEQAVVQILWNLLSNELKYAVKDPRVRARIYAESGYACVEICDFGPGMRRRDRRRAFNRFWQATTKPANVICGFGIGLCASRESARAMRGDITLTKNKPKGSVFTLRLPLAGERTQ